MKRTMEERVTELESRFDYSEHCFTRVHKRHWLLAVLGIAALLFSLVALWALWALGAARHLLLCGLILLAATFAGAATTVNNSTPIAGPGQAVMIYATGYTSPTAVYCKAPGGTTLACTVTSFSAYTIAVRLPDYGTTRAVQVWVADGDATRTLNKPEPVKVRPEYPDSSETATLEGRWLDRYNRAAWGTTESVVLKNMGDLSTSALTVAIANPVEANFTVPAALADGVYGIYFDEPGITGTQASYGLCTFSILATIPTPGTQVTAASLGGTTNGVACTITINETDSKITDWGPGRYIIDGTNRDAAGNIFLPNDCEWRGAGMNLTTLTLFTHDSTKSYQFIKTMGNVKVSNMTIETSGTAWSTGTDLYLLSVGASRAWFDHVKFCSDKTSSGSLRRKGYYPVRTTAGVTDVRFTGCVFETALPLDFDTGPKDMLFSWCTFPGSRNSFDWYGGGDYDQDGVAVVIRYPGSAGAYARHVSFVDCDFSAQNPDSPHQRGMIYSTACDGISLVRCANTNHATVGGTQGNYSEGGLAMTHSVGADNAGWNGRIHFTGDGTTFTLESTKSGSITNITYGSVMPFQILVTTGTRAGLLMDCQPVSTSAFTIVGASPFAADETATASVNVPTRNTIIFDSNLVSRTNRNANATFGISCYGLQSDCLYTSNSFTGCAAGIEFDVSTANAAWNVNLWSVGNTFTSCGMGVVWNMYGPLPASPAWFGESCFNTGSIDDRAYMTPQGDESIFPLGAAFAFDSDAHAASNIRALSQRAPVGVLIRGAYVTGCDQFVRMAHSAIHTTYTYGLKLPWANQVYLADNYCVDATSKTVYAEAGNTYVLSGNTFNAVPYASIASATGSPFYRQKFKDVSSSVRRNADNGLYVWDADGAAALTLAFADEESETITVSESSSILSFSTPTLTIAAGAGYHRETLNLFDGTATRSLPIIVHVGPFNSGALHTSGTWQNGFEVTLDTGDWRSSYTYDGTVDGTGHSFTSSTPGVMWGAIPRVTPSDQRVWLRPEADLTTPGNHAVIAWLSTPYTRQSRQVLGRLYFTETHFVEFGAYCDRAYTSPQMDVSKTAAYWAEYDGATSTVLGAWPFEFVGEFPVAIEYYRGTCTAYTPWAQLTATGATSGTITAVATGAWSAVGTNYYQGFDGLFAFSEVATGVAYTTSTLEGVIPTRKLSITTMGDATSVTAGLGYVSTEGGVLVIASNPGAGGAGNYTLTLLRDDGSTLYTGAVSETQWSEILLTGWGYVFTGDLRVQVSDLTPGVTLDVDIVQIDAGWGT